MKIAPTAHVVVCGDTNYPSQFLRPFFWSLKKAHAHSCVQVHFLIVNGTPEYQTEIKTYCAMLQLPIFFYEVGKRLYTLFSGDIEKIFINGVEQKSHWATTCYTRLLAAETLPADIEYAIYMDLDTLCLCDTHELLALTTDCKSIAACPDRMLFYLRNGVGKWDDRFNSGVLVIPIAIWRQEKILEKILSLFNKYKAINQQPLGLDQGILNDCFENNWQKLPAIWNVQMHEFQAGIGLSTDLKNAKLFHYSGGNKPWSQPNALIHFPKPAALAYSRALVGSSSGSSKLRHRIVIATYCLFCIGKDNPSLFLHRVLTCWIEVLWGREPVWVIFRWFKNTYLAK